MSLTRLIPMPNGLRSFLQLQRGMLFQYGWLRSLRSGKPVDRHGRPVPWFSQPAIDFLSQFDYREKDVFEWGAGHSTLFWAARCRSVVSIENNPEWAAYLKDLVPSNVELIASAPDNESYVGRIRGRGKFHIIVIDGTGYGRMPGAAEALDHLADGGMIILDDSDMLLQTTRFLRERLTQIDFTGFRPGSGHAYATSIFFRTLDFKPLGVQPVLSSAQPNKPWQPE